MNLGITDEARKRIANSIRVGILQRAATLDMINAAAFTQHAEAAGQLLNDTVLPGAQLVEIDLRLVEADAPVACFGCFIDQLRHVQQRL